MSQPYVPNSELRRLIAGLCDDTLSAADVERLQSWLKSDPAALTYYVQYLGVHASLAWTVSAHHGSTDERPMPVSRLPRWIRWSWRAIRKPTPLSMTVATIVLGIVITAMQWMTVMVWMSPRERTATTDVVPAIAVLENTTDVQWFAGQQPLAHGTMLAPGQRLQLRRGLAEIRFLRGATMVLEAPVDFTVSKSNGGDLTFGKLTARIDEERLFFFVQTPTARVVDLGTEFGVAHEDELKESVVHVYEGSVEVSRVSYPQRVQTIGSGEVLKVNQSGMVRSTPSAAPFIRPREFAKIAAAGPRNQAGLPKVVADARRDFQAVEQGATSFDWQHRGLRGSSSGVWNYYRSRTLDTTDARAKLQLLEFMPDQEHHFLMYCCPQFNAHVPAVHNRQMFFHPEHDGAPKANELAVHPGEESNYGVVVVRWTATGDSPAKVRVLGAARMLGYAPASSASGVDFAIWSAGEVQHQTAIAAADNVGTSFDFEAGVMPGGHLDFVVGPHGDFSNDQVGLNVQILDASPQRQPRAADSPEKQK